MEETAQKNEHSSFVDRSISSILKLIYSKDKKYERYVILITIIGFFLRLIAALHLDVLADDMVHISQSAGILSAKILSTHSNPPLFFYLTDIAFNIFGYTTLASRFFPLIAGTLLIPLSFLIAVEIFRDKRIGLFSAIFVALSAFLTRNTFGEASLIVLLFSMLGVYLGLLYLDSRKKAFIIFSGISFGLGVLTKYNAPFFILSFLIYSMVFLKIKNEKIFTKKHIYDLILFIFIIFIFALPPLTFNYLLYKDKGIVDVYFSRVIQTEATQQLYGGLAGQENSFASNFLNLANYGSISVLYKVEFILLIFALLGLFYLIKGKKIKEISFILLLFIIPFIFQAAGAPLPKHFVFMVIILSLPAGYGLIKLSEKIKNKKLFIGILIFAIALMIVSMGITYGSPPNYLQSSATSQLKSYISNNVQDKDVIVLDPRIYTSRSLWIATPYDFVNSYTFIELNNAISKAPEEYKHPVKVYFIECVVEDCGWGTISSQQELNESTEFFFSQVNNISKIEKEISSKVYSGNEFYSTPEEKVTYRIYSQTIYSNKNAFKEVSKQNSFYFVPYMYQNMNNYIFDYSLNSTTDRVLERISNMIISLAIVLAIMSIVILSYLILRLNVYGSEG